MFAVWQEEFDLARKALQEEAGRLIHVIGARFPLDRIVPAHEAQERGSVIGNIVIDVAPDAD